MEAEGALRRLCEEGGVLRGCVLFDMGRAMSRTNALDLWEWQASLPPYLRVRLRGTLKPSLGLSSNVDSKHSFLLPYLQRPPLKTSQCSPLLCG